MAMASESFKFLLVATCTIVALIAQLGLAEATTDVAECFPSLSSVEGSIEATEKPISENKFDDVGRACCTAFIKPGGDNFWPIILPKQPCMLLFNLNPSADLLP